MWCLYKRIQFFFLTHFTPNSNQIIGLSNVTIKATTGNNNHNNKKTMFLLVCLKCVFVCAAELCRSVSSAATVFSCHSYMRNIPTFVQYDRDYKRKSQIFMKIVYVTICVRVYYIWNMDTSYFVQVNFIIKIKNRTCRSCIQRHTQRHSSIHIS